MTVIVLHSGETNPMNTNKPTFKLTTKVHSFHKLLGKYSTKPCPMCWECALKTIPQVHNSEYEYRPSENNRGKCSVCGAITIHNLSILLTEQVEKVALAVYQNPDHNQEFEGFILEVPELTRSYIFSYVSPSIRQSILKAKELNNG